MSRMKLWMGAGALAALAVAAGGYAVAQAVDDVHPGKLVYDASCAACHNNPPAGDRAAPVASLRKMSAQTLMTALTTGVMKPIGDSLTGQQRRDVVAYLAAPETGGSDMAWIDGGRCAADKRDVDLTPAPAQIGYGVDLANSRSMSRKQAGLKGSDLAKLEVAWTLAMPRTTGLRGQGVVVGSTLFYPAGQAGQLLALDTKTGCIKWNTPAPAGFRNSLAYGQLGKGGPMALVAGDNQGQLVAFDAKTGKQIWRVDPRHDKTAPISGTALFAGDKIIVPISAMDVAAAMRPNYECCKVHGDVAAVDAATGKLIWTWHTMEPAKPLGRKNSAGAELYGPSGAPIWSSPSVDLKRGVVYASTGENTSPPATKTSDAIVAIDLATGKEKWVFQALANDVWNMSCPVGIDADRKPGPNCFFAKEGSVLLDHDFGGGPVLAKGKGGKDVVLGGQKSGDVWALDAAAGKVLWRHQFGKGSALGGVHWGIGADAKRVYAPINDPTVPEDKSAAGMHVVDIASGKIAWQWRATPDCGNGRKARVPICDSRFGLSAPPLIIDGAVVAGALDGRMFVWQAASGELLATYDTAVPFETINGLKGAGGSIDAAGPFAGDGMLFVGSGYASFGQQAGNVLVAYRPKK